MEDEAVRQVQVKRMKRVDRSISWLEVKKVGNKMRQVNVSIEGEDERKRVGQRCRKGWYLWEVWKKERKAEGAESAAAGKAAWSTRRRKAPAVHDSLELLDDGLAPSWLRNIRAKLHQASLILLHLDSGRLPLICWANAARGLETLVSAHASCSPAVSKVQGWHGARFCRLEA